MEQGLENDEGRYSRTYDRTAEPCGISVHAHTLPHDGKCYGLSSKNRVTVQKWIPVTERLPEKEKDVLMYFDTDNMAVGFWHDGDEHITFWCAWTDDGWYTDCDVEPLYWMLLSQAPKEKTCANDAAVTVDEI